MLVTIYTFIDIHYGVVIDEIATTDESFINMLEQKWLANTGFLVPGITGTEARKDYEEIAGECHCNYKIYSHVLEITTETKIVQTNVLTSETTTESP